MQSLYLNREVAVLSCSAAFHNSTCKRLFFQVLGRSNDNWGEMLETWEYDSEVESCKFNTGFVSPLENLENSGFLILVLKNLWKPWNCI